MDSSIAPSRPGASAGAAAIFPRWLAGVLRDWRSARRMAAQRQAFSRLDAAELRDLGMSRTEYDSYLAEARGLAPRTRLRTARPPQPDAWL